MKLKAAIIFSLLFSLVIGACNNTSLNDKQESTDTVPVAKKATKTTIGGTYAYGTNLEKEAVGKLMVYPLGDSTALFYLDVNRGAPSYNMGLLAGKLIYKESTWTYEGDCKLIFDFSPGEVQVSTVKEQANCGFGNGVTANHVYQLTNNAVPEFYVTGEGDTVYFKNLKL